MYKVLVVARGNNCVAIEVIVFNSLRAAKNATKRANDLQSVRATLLNEDNPDDPS